MKGLKGQSIIVVLMSFSLFITAQTQIGSDIEGHTALGRFGRSTSISADGNIVVLGGWDFPLPGVIRVYKNIDGVWTIYGTEISNDNSGSYAADVSLSSDGDTLAIFFPSVGIKVFNYDPETDFWIQMGNDITANDLIDSFNSSSDGNTIVIGLAGITGGGPPAPVPGYTQIFRYEGGGWNQVGNDIHGLDQPEVQENSGYDVTASSDGNIIAISNSYSVRIFQNVSGTWTIMGEEILSGINWSLLTTTSLSSDGQTLVIGEPDFTDSLIQRGRVRVFNFESGTWNQVGSDILGEVAYYRTGWSVSLSSDGQVLAIGEIGVSGSSIDTGRTRIFENQGGSWVQIGNDIFGEAIEDHSGYGVSLSSDASTLIIGSPYNDANNATDSGQARVYNLSSLLSVNDFIPPNIRLFPNPAREQFTIQLHDGMELEKVNIYNSLGKLVKSVFDNVISTSKLSTGIYHVEIYTTQGKTTKKLVII